jgi:hypothetical protein
VPDESRRFFQAHEVIKDRIAIINRVDGGMGPLGRPASSPTAIRTEVSQLMPQLDHEPT